MSELLAPHLGEVWRPDDPASEREVLEAETLIGHRFPEDYRELLLTAGAGCLYGQGARILLFPLRHLGQFNPLPDVSGELTKMFIFGNDEGDFFYFFDTGNRMGKGHWAVFAIEASVPDVGYAYPVAPSLREAVEKVLAGEELF